MLYDAGGLIFTGTNLGFSYAVHASGTYDWDAVGNTGIWSISLPFDPYLNGVNLGGWFNGFSGSVQMTTTFSPTSFDTSNTLNNGTVNGDISMVFASPLGQTLDSVTGQFQVQNDFAPYDFSGTISGFLAPAASVPEPSVLIFMLVGIIALSAMKRWVHAPASAKQREVLSS